MKKGMIIFFGIFLGISTLAFAVASVFNDVEYGAYYFAPVHDMEAKGILTGYGDGNFGPNDAMTRGQLATALSRYDEHMHMTLQSQYGLSFVCPVNDELNCVGGGPIGSGCRNVEYMEWMDANCEATVLEQPAAFKEYDTGKFTFSYPSDWAYTSEVEDYSGVYSSEIVTFVNQEEEVMLTFRCPPLETGYEAWNFESSEKVITKDSIDYDVRLSLGTEKPEWESGVGGLALLSVSHPDDWFENCTFITSPSSYETDEDQFKAMEDIYNSIN